MKPANPRGTSPASRSPTRSTLGLLIAERKARLHVRVVDDSAELRSAVRAYLYGAADAQVVGDAADGDEAAHEVERDR